MSRNGKTGKQEKVKPLLEWVAAAIGLLLTLGIIGFIGWQAITGPDEAPPQISVEAGPLTPYGAGYVVEFIARNRSSTTASAVEIEGKLMDGSTEKATSSATLSYVPGHSERRGGLFFSEDPRRYRLELRPLGYSRP